MSLPTIRPERDELVLEANSLVNISCTGESEVVWEEPLPDDTTVTSDGFTSTLLIYNATIKHSGFFECRHKYGEGHLGGVAEIYIIVKGKNKIIVI